jgi:parvulin-like peptidyl-prolyl isomerase
MMRRNLHPGLSHAVRLVLCAVVCAMLCVATRVRAQATTPASGEDLDRIVAVVNGDIILDSDVDEERRFNAFQPFRDSTADFSREKAIERLINRDLILQQARLQPEDRIADADLDKEIVELRKSIPECKAAHCETEDGWQKFLAAHGFNDTAFRERWRQRMEVLRFVEERFRAGIRIPDADIAAYYNKTLVPEFARQHVAPPTLASVSDRIQEVLLQQQVSNLLRDWLKSLRAQGSVVVLQEGQVAP